MESQNPPSDDSASEHTPLLSASSGNRPKNGRSVTFSENPVTRTIEPEPEELSSSPAKLSRNASLGSAVTPGAGASHGATASGGVGGNQMLVTLNSKLRRRNSHSAVTSAALNTAGPKIGPQRSTKKTEKLKLLPNPDLGAEEQDEESGRDVYSQYTRIKDPTARRDAARLGKADRERLPRVTAYCTANKYEMEGLMRFLKGRGKTRGANPKLIDECIYTPYNYDYAKQNQARPDPIQNYSRRYTTGSGASSNDSFYHSSPEARLDGRHPSQGNGSHQTDGADLGRISSDALLGPSVVDDIPVAESIPDFDIQVHTPEVFLFDYGVIVVWGMTEVQEAKFLKDISKFEVEKLAPDDVETEHFNFYYTREYQARIYNDFITLRDKNNYMTKLAISHALAQSVKTSLFEELIASTVETCKDIPTQIALTGKIALSRSQINMQIGELFILRINIHLNGSVLDTPELFWVEPQLEPVYQAVRSYLEMDQRVGLLTERLDVIADLLAVLKDQLSHGHGEKLEWIVIVLIAAEILVAAINIVVDVYAGEI
ncbi:hypothetical protein S40285_06598 [Stachybotrys chlorohalonatus IBT 40285]|uniref:DUF155 domain-containing protein n=1 Tax=Stachybotrys chlorohalonatus (strain IBT 40285) TaxID=1283841 RepID=A0A084QHG9_STAC4|nr:hypothetical protein S40285_06598 [Stachybotrys chlorohalonata IBT 40285]